MGLMSSVALNATLDNRFLLKQLIRVIYSKTFLPTSSILLSDNVAWGELADSSYGVVLGLI